MLELLNKLISGAKEKLVSAWNWVKGIFTSEKAIVKNKKVATIVVTEEDEVNTYSKNDVEEEKEACKFADEILSKELNVENVEEVVESLVTKISEVKSVNAKLLILHTSVHEHFTSFLESNKDSLAEKYTLLNEIVAGVFKELRKFPSPEFISEEVFSMSLYSKDKIVTKFVVVIEEKK